MDESYTVPDGTLPLLGGILTMMDFAHRNMTQIIADLPGEALVWQPATDMGTLSGIICHTMYCEVYAIRLAAGEDVSYDLKFDESEEEHSTWRTAEDRDALMARIAAGDAIMKRILPIMTVAGMGERFPAWGGNALQQWRRPDRRSRDSYDDALGPHADDAATLGAGTSGVCRYVYAVVTIQARFNAAAFAVW